MTRGTFVLFTKLGLWQSTEFNGGMAPEWIDQAGGAALKLLPKLKAEVFESQIAMFNSENHNYDDDPIASYQEGHMTPVYEPDSKGEWIVHHHSNAFDLTQDYFKKYFSDYLYIKNAEDNDTIEIILEDGIHEIEPGGWIVTNYNNEIANEDGVVFSSLTYNTHA